MMIHIPQVLDAAAVAHCRQVMQRAEWADGRITAGHQSAQVKNNMQMPEGSSAHRELGKLVMAGLDRSPLFMSAALPLHVFPPLFNRYDPGMSFGSHVDNSIRTNPFDGRRIRTDLSATLFISEPDEYDGGELIVEDTYGEHAVKLPAGDMILYPANSLHRVQPISRGSRIASFFWIQSMVRDDTKRALLFDLDMSIVRLNADVSGHPSVVNLTSTYHNLLRLWTEV
ncbi:MAG: PKHD-type hydroxylase [Hyphomicrobiales bacterium]|nr:PKHD-type hydroxylase [Hyphomicrobiales bacterium]